MKRVVIDTNIFISAIGWRGIPQKILELWKTNKYHLVLSLEIVDEIEKTIEKLGLSQSLWQEWRSLIFERAYFVEGESLNLPEIRDSKDKKVLNCAILSDASFIVSGDKDLLVLKKHKDIKIITPRSFLSQFKDEP